MIGKKIRIERILNRKTGRSVIVPMDMGFHRSGGRYNKNGRDH